MTAMVAASCSASGAVPDCDRDRQPLTAANLEPSITTSSAGTPCEVCSPGRGQRPAPSGRCFRSSDRAVPPGCACGVQQDAVGSDHARAPCSVALAAERRWLAGASGPGDRRPRRCTEATSFPLRARRLHCLWCWRVLFDRGSETRTPLKAGVGTPPQRGRRYLRIYAARATSKRRLGRARGWISYGIRKVSLCADRRVLPGQEGQFQPSGVSGLHGRFP